MTHSRTFGGRIFDDDFLSMRGGVGERPVRFTRSERIVLRRLVDRAGSIVTRETLLDALSGYGSDARDRSVDYIVNRLRRKLGDPARSPRFVATRYGEGYVWIAREDGSASPVAAFIVIGPITGTGRDEASDRLAAEFVDRLRRGIERLTEPNRTVVVASGGPAGLPPDGDRASFGLELAFLPFGPTVDCALTLRDLGTQTIVSLTRHDLAQGGVTAAAQQTRRIAEAVVDQIWTYLSRIEQETPRLPPLPVRLYEAVESISAQTAIWHEAERRMRNQLRCDPTDPIAKLLLATALHSKYITSGVEVLTVSDPRLADEAEIEALVMQALPDLQDNGIYALTAAKLLYFCNKAHRALVFDIAERAFRSTSAFASAAATYGQLLMWTGRMGEALDLLDHAAGLADTGSHFARYVLVLKCQAHQAAGKRACLAPLATELCRLSPAAARYFCIFYEPTNEIDVEGALDDAFADMQPNRARAFLLHAHHVCARHFEDPCYRARTMETPLRRIVGRFGAGVVPEEVVDDRAREVPRRPLGRPTRGPPEGGSSPVF